MHHRDLCYPAGREQVEPGYRQQLGLGPPNSCLRIPVKQSLNLDNPEAIPPHHPTLVYSETRGSREVYTACQLKHVHCFLNAPERQGRRIQKRLAINIYTPSSLMQYKSFADGSGSTAWPVLHPPTVRLNPAAYLIDTSLKSSSDICLSSHDSRVISLKRGSP